MTTEHTIDEIKEEAAAALGKILRELNKIETAWKMKGSLGCNRVRDSLELEIIDPRLLTVANYNYTPLYRQDDYILIAYSLQIKGAPVGFGVLNPIEGIETFLEVDTDDIVEWIVPSRESIKDQMELVPTLITLIEEAKNLLH